MADGTRDAAQGNVDVQGCASGSASECDSGRSGSRCTGNDVSGGGGSRGGGFDNCDTQSNGGHAYVYVRNTSGNRRGNTASFTVARNPLFDADSARSRNGLRSGSARSEVHPDPGSASAHERRGSRAVAGGNGAAAATAATGTGPVHATPLASARGAGTAQAGARLAVPTSSARAELITPQLGGMRPAAFQAQARATAGAAFDAADTQARPLVPSGGGGHAMGQAQVRPPTARVH